jgi:hypothetical protein
MIRWYWRQTGGTLVEEYRVVRGSSTCGQRSIDALILPNGETTVLNWREVPWASLEGEDLIVVQAKKGRLGMSLMGQTFFSAELMKRFKPASVRSIALCELDDSVLRPILESYPNMEIVIYPGGH